MTLGQRLKHARLAQFPRVLQKDAAELLGITRSAYAAYESDLARPRPESLKKLATSWNVSYGWLTEGDGNPPSVTGSVASTKSPYGYDTLRLLDAPTGELNEEFLIPIHLTNPHASRFVYRVRQHNVLEMPVDPHDVLVVQECEIWTPGGEFVLTPPDQEGRRHVGIGVNPSPLRPRKWEERDMVGVRGMGRDLPPYFGPHRDLLLVIALLRDYRTGSGTVIYDSDGLHFTRIPYDWQFEIRG